MRILLEPGGAGGGGGKLEVVEDIDAAMQVLAQRGAIGDDLLPKGDKPASGTPAAGAGAKADEELTERADEAGRTVEEQRAHEQTDEYKAEVEAAQLAERAQAAGRTAEEQQAFEADNKQDEGEAPEFSDEQRAWMVEQGLLDAEGQLIKPAAPDEELKGKLEAAETKAKDLETKLAENGGVRVTIAPMHRYFTMEPADLEKEEAKLEEQEAFLMKHWDGIDPVEASADGKTPAAPGYTKEQVREAYTLTQKLRQKTLPAARETYQLHVRENEAAKKAYPELFDSKRSECTVAQGILKQAPGLRTMFPNIMTILGDAMRGEKLRLAEEAKKKGTVIGKVKVPASIKVAPKVPLGSKPAPAGSGKGVGKGVLSAARHEELGGDRAALVKLVEEGILN